MTPLASRKQKINNTCRLEVRTDKFVLSRSKIL